uniref:Ubiquitin-protein ligase n=1 Tax=Solanum tuberosum TaxID=4113 RepID=M1CI67_SOLTU
MENGTPLHPYDILFFVFMGLSIKSLLRFKSVFTYWRAIISEDTFVKAQRDQSKALGRRKLLLKNRTSGEFKLIDIENPKFISETQEEFLLKNYVVLCSLDGLLLLKEENYMNFVLWNPSTRQHRNLESYPYVNDYILPHACSLCYDDSIR